MFLSEQLFSLNLLYAWSVEVHVVLCWFSGAAFQKLGRETFRVGFSFYRLHDNNYSLAKSKVSSGKSQTETLLY